MSPETLSRIEAAVTAIERSSDAEIVVVAAARSGQYRDLAAAGASATAAGVLVAMFLLPHEWTWYGSLLELGLTWGFTAVVLDRSGLSVRLASSARRARQVEDAAHMEFSREGVHATPHRTGVLVYHSRDERLTVLLPDVGVLGAIAPGALADAKRALADADIEQLAPALTRLEPILTSALPARETDLIDLPNAPRVRR